MKYRPLKSKDVIRALEKIGFENRGGARHVKMFRPSSGTIITIPRAHDLSPSLVRAVVKQVSGRGDASEEDIERGLFDL
ncbi:type II toxin-antitoxin system HicA family toxin [Stenotrophomonas maltophilia]|uniref:type II toxin-antitoxin system HicA family toxin n=1 Tax=Stenotrophomonas maltophilia TaxID=40324 RepID=UPI003204216D|nr:type II toxin-antitoxin system HicA family toxin [Stenotrophomonas maltophilia]